MLKANAIDDVVYFWMWSKMIEKNNELSVTARDRWPQGTDRRLHVWWSPSKSECGKAGLRKAKRPSRQRS